MQLADHQLQQRKADMRRTILTATELEGTPDDARIFESVGKM
jgi:chaperonin cofactor prefoldin